jgi:hypothetical protein
MLKYVVATYKSLRKANRYASPSLPGLRARLQGSSNDRDLSPRLGDDYDPAGTSTIPPPREREREREKKSSPGSPPVHTERLTDMALNAAELRAKANHVLQSPVSGHSPPRLRGLRARLNWFS